MQLWTRLGNQSRVPRRERGGKARCLIICLMHSELQQLSEYEQNRAGGFGSAIEQLTQSEPINGIADEIVQALSEQAEACEKMAEATRKVAELNERLVRFMIR